MGMVLYKKNHYQEKNNLKEKPIQIFTNYEELVWRNKKRGFIYRLKPTLS